MSNKTVPHISVVIPFYNEESSIKLLIGEIETALKDYEYEVVFIDDGSSDNSVDLLKECREKNKRLKLVIFCDNYGQQAAFTAGYLAARGDIIVTMDSDMQNDPADIPLFVEKIDKEGYSAAFGWRISRENSFFLRLIPSMAFNWVRNNLLHRSLHDYGCGMNAFKREFVDELADTPVYLKHITTYIARKKVPFVEVQVKERKRHAGKSRYDLMRLVQLGLDLLITISPKPLATFVFLLTAGVSFALSALTLAYFLISHLSGSGMTLEYLIYPYIFFVSSVVLGGLALINEKVFFALQHLYKRPIYIIREFLD